MDFTRAMLPAPVGSDGMGDTPTPAPRGAAPPRKPAVTRETVEKARVIYQKCRDGKQTHDQRVTEDEEWYRGRYESRMVEKDEGGKPITRAFKTSSGWLFNNLANKHADAMDNYPRPNLLPREPGDMAEAETLTAIIPALLQQIHFEETYSDVNWNKIKFGTGIYGVFWDGQANGGIGEIAIRSIDPVSIFWDPGVRDIQKSRHVFLAATYDRDEILERYPQAAEDIGSGYETATIAEYRNDDYVNKDKQCTVFDWYYKKWVGGRQVVHLCKFCGSAVLYASENDPTYAERGFYDHGWFPFVFDILYPVKNSPVGFGMIDICRNPQEYIDRLDAAILENAIGGSTPRYLCKKSSGINKQDFSDFTKKLIEYEGERDAIVPIQTKPLEGIYISVQQNKIAELKEISGNRDVTQGGTTSGVTAASAIAALVETGSKLSRDSSRGSYRAFRQVIELVVELIRQFYTSEHKFRIIGKDGQAEFVAYRTTGETTGRKAIFDIEITAERASSYSRLSQNELMLQLYNAGFFNPQNVDASLAAIDGMAFDQKEQVRKRIAAGGTMADINRQLMATNEQLAAYTGDPNVMAAVAEQNAQTAAVMQQASGTDAAAVDLDPTTEPPQVGRMRERVADSTVPM